MTATGRLSLVVMTMPALLMVAGLFAQTPADVAGDWALMVDTDAGTTTPSVVLEQDGTELTGHYSSETLGEADVTGTVSGNEVRFSFSASAQGFDVDVSYTGTLQDDGTLSGQISLGDLGGGTFTGKRR
ncbi:MAG: hypothetical protein VX427_15850 [Acidobacteriota bacterium]|nr:hypothetical protein [Acidobacteriota bacterium]